MNKFHNRVKGRLYRKGCSGFTQADYDDAAIAVTVFNPNDPTEEELKKGVEHLSNKFWEKQKRLKEEEEERQRKYMDSAFRERKVIECAVAIELTLKEKGIYVPYSELVSFADQVIGRTRNN
ncbi:MAG: hypothetical protein HC815_36080 [Richelia sp. RM1_1_1]|nr:hypothetical protein [Richelia sp. RM1_1_1]